jgi:hypothetical protein
MVLTLHSLFHFGTGDTNRECTGAGTILYAVSPVQEDDASSAVALVVSSYLFQSFRPVPAAS